MEKQKKRKIIDEFKAFALRGNVIDLAVGVIIGGAFSKITNSLVNDVFMPFVGMFIGGVDFSKIVLKLPSLFPGKEPVLINLGLFIGTVIDFLILAFIVFMIVKLINKLKRKQEKEPEKAVVAPTKEEQLLTEIRDILKGKADKN